MANQSPISFIRASASFLILGSLACFIVVGIYAPYDGLYPSSSYHVWERGLIITAVILTALGFGLLEDVFKDPKPNLFAKISSRSYFFAAVLLVGAEAMALRLRWEQVTPLILIYVFLAYLAQIALGVALVRSQLIAIWIGWITILWNITWLLAGLIFGETFLYIPLLHHTMPFAIGIALFWKTVKGAEFSNS